MRVTHRPEVETVEPFVFDSPADVKTGRNFPIPDLTELPLSDRWEETDQKWFVDSSGLGRDDEPALTADQFRAELLEYVQQHPGHGFGLSGTGQFQVYVSAYRRVEGK